MYVKLPNPLNEFINSFMHSVLFQLSMFRCKMC